MTKSLGSIAGVSLVLACVFFTLSAMVSPDRNLNLDMSSKGSSEQGSRHWAWDGGDRLEIRVPAKVTLMDGGEPGVTVRGPQDVLKDVNFRNGRLSGESRRFCPIVFFCGRHNEGIEVELHGVHPSEIDISGVAQVDLGHLDQDRLALHVSGAGQIDGEGRLNRLDLSISGAGQASLGKLAVANATVSLSGAGEAEIAPSEEADVSISGMGHVELTTKPKHLTSHVSGMGSVDGPGSDDSDDNERDRDRGDNRRISDEVQQTVQKALDDAHIQDNVKKSVKKALDDDDVHDN